MKIFGKLMGAFAIVAGIAAVIGAVGLMGVRSVGDGLTQVATVSTPALEGVALLHEASQAMRAEERTVVSPSLSATRRQEVIAQMDQHWATADKGMIMYRDLPKVPEEEQAWQAAQAAWNQWRAEHDALVGYVGDVKLSNLAQLEAVLAARLLDHVRWVNALEGSINTGSEFNKQLDHTKCGFGRWLVGYKTDDPKFQQVLAEFDTPHAKLHNLGADIKRLMAAGNDVAARTLLEKEVVPTLGQIEEIFAKARLYVGEDMDQFDKAVGLAFGDAENAFASMNESLNRLSEVIHHEADEAVAGAESAATTSQWTTIVVLLLGVAAALGFGFVLARSIARPMQQTSDMLAEMEQGHLDRRLHMKRSDEIGSMANAMDAFADSLEQEVVHPLRRLADGDLTFLVAPRDDRDLIRGALKKLGDDLNEMIQSIQVAGDQIASGAGQVSDSSQALSQGATTQAASMEEISSSMTEMTSQTGSSAENASSASQLSRQARESAEQGNRQMEQMMASMNEIQSAGQSISGIIKTIDEIAFQTNLLALNAAVEAARAGQHGKGFAVVAEEVRNLAARSAKAAKETADLIAGSVQATENGFTIASETAKSLEAIVTGATKVSDLISEIAAAANEQAEGFGQVNTGLQQIDQVTQQNTASAEEGASAAEELASQAAYLRDMLSRFKLRSQQAEWAAVAQQVPDRSTSEEREEVVPVEPQHVIEGGWG